MSRRQRKTRAKVRRHQRVQLPLTLSTTTQAREPFIARIFKGLHGHLKVW